MPLWRLLLWAALPGVDVTNMNSHGARDWHCSGAGVTLERRWSGAGVAMEGLWGCNGVVSFLIFDFFRFLIFDFF